MRILGEISMACRRGNLHLVREFLTSAEGKSFSTYPVLLQEAILGGQLEIVKFLTTSNELERHADIHYAKDLALVYSCSSNRLDIVQYLLSSPELKTHCDVHTLADAPIREACNNGYPEMVQYLLDNYDITISDNLYKLVYKRRELEKQNKIVNIKNPKPLDSYKQVLDIIHYHREKLQA